MGDREKLTQLPTLPTEIIPEILAWLEVKPLCRFRCVSKSWNSLISEPGFVKLHSSKAIEHEQVLRQRHRVMATGERGKVYIFDLNELFDQVDLDNPEGQVVVSESESDSIGDSLNDSDSLGTESESDDQLDDDSYDSDDDMHSCLPFYSNGLVLKYLSNYDKFKLYNPATRESKVLSKPNSKFLWQNVNQHKLYGFGFDSSCLDYKMVCGEYYRYELWFSVYSLKTGSWRVIPRGYDYGALDLKSNMEGIVVNGNIHWLVRTKDSASSMVLVSFLVAEEMVRTIPLPPGFNSEGGDYYLTVFRECLCVAVKGGPEYWIMNEYGVRESWTQQRMSVPSSRWLHLGFRKNNHELVYFDDRQRLVMYNFNEDRFCNLPFCDRPGIKFAAIYVETIFSLKCYRGFD
ncbi:F-box/kelch-repeat protein At3g06240-like [Rosa rugosa]|uniref:F-box/kelch-repeat protein At3g06240-like n=1 Tax=Rosa rugosa TaxID=74645 RepID=UPI002B4137EC|nr:F-box/kelch-repeat protein At3g06240-like [Rosa rugosa]